MTHSCDLRVSGIPTSLYEDDLVLDKLLIHFLHRKNGGSGEVEVHYPTSESGVAMLTFDQVEVAEEVLTRTHQLEIRKHTYPLEVSRPQRQRTQFSMPITTTLSLEYFDDRSEVIALLEKQGLKVYREESSYLFIEGDFRDLSRCRDELYKTMRSCSHQVENRMSRRDQYQLKEHSKDRGRVAGKQIPIDNMPDKPSYKTSNRKPSPIRTKITEPLPAENDGYSSTGDRSRQPHIKQFLISNGSSQRRSKDTSSSDSTSIRKYPNIAANLHFHPTPPTKGPTDEDRTGKNSPLPSNGKPADSSELASHVALPGTQFKEDLPGSRQLKHTFAAESSSSQSKPKDNIADGLISNQKYPNSTMGDGSDFNPGQPKNTSTNALNSNQKHTNSTIEGSTKFNSGQPKKTSVDEFNSRPNHSKSPTGDSTKFNSGQPKKTSTDEINSNTSHSKSTMRDGTKFSSGQPKKTSTEELSSSKNHSKSTISDSTKFNSGQPKNISTDELNSNPNHSKSTLGNVKPGKPQNSSPEEFHLNPRNLEDLTARPSNPSSLMAAGWSSSSSPTGNSLTAINPKNHLDESSLSTDLLVDPAAHTYVSVFMKDAIDDILSLSDAEITTEKGEGYNRVILTSKSPHLSRLFYKAAHEISDIFIKCQRILRLQSIELSNISADVTKKLQSYLFRCGIWSLADEKRLQMIGPSRDITRFMEEWTSAGGDFVRFVPSSQGVSPASSRPPVVGMDNVHQATTHSHNVAHDVQRARPRHHSAESGARGGTRRPNSTNRSNSPFNKPWK